MLQVLQWFCGTLQTLLLAQLGLGRTSPDRKRRDTTACLIPATRETSETRSGVCSATRRTFSCVLAGRRVQGRDVTSAHNDQIERQELPRDVGTVCTQPIGRHLRVHSIERVRVRKVNDEVHPCEVKVLRAARAPFLLIKPAACVQFAALRVDQYVLPRLHTSTRLQVKSSKSASSDAVPLCGDALSKNEHSAVSTFCENWLLPSF